MVDYRNEGPEGPASRLRLEAPNEYGGRQDLLAPMMGAIGTNSANAPQDSGYTKIYRSSM